MNRLLAMASAAALLGLATPGVARATTITLHLSQSTNVNNVDLLNWPNPGGNMIPGTITGVTVGIGSTTEAFATVGFGGNSGSQVPGNEQVRVDLSQSGLNTMSTSTITLSNFLGGWFEYFSISEIIVNGGAVAISSYDIDSTPGAGFGGWSHTYNGTITSLGNGNFSYSGGSGTMNDGQAGTSEQNTHLFHDANNAPPPPPPAPVPEPTTLALLGMGAASAMLRRRK